MSDYHFQSSRYYELHVNNKTFNYTLEHDRDAGDSIDSFGKTFICAALFPVVTVFIMLVVWKALHPYCDKAAGSTGNSSTNSGVNHRDSLSTDNNTRDLHSIFILDIRTLPQTNSSPVDESKNEPPPSYDDEILSLPSYEEAIKNLTHPDPVT